MDKIGHWCISSQKLMTGEIVHWSCFANHTQSRRRAVGGKLYITNYRMLFNPHLIDFILFGKKWNLLLKEVESIIKATRRKNLLNGSIGERLKIKQKNQNEDYFVVRDIDRVINKISIEMTKRIEGQSLNSELTLT